MHAGAVWPCQVCKRTSVLLPARSGHVSRVGETILHLDHHCWWLDAPIGHFNRRYFILFLLWSAALAVYSTALVVHDGHERYAWTARMYAAYEARGWPEWSTLRTVALYYLCPTKYAYDVLHAEGLTRHLVHSHALALLLIADVAVAVRTLWRRLPFTHRVR